jgi:hypothetical protein
MCVTAQTLPHPCGTVLRSCPPFASATVARGTYPTSSASNLRSFQLLRADQEMPERWRQKPNTIATWKKSNVNRD